MDSPGLAYPPPMEEWADLNFPVLSPSSDIDNWVSSHSLKSCCSDDYHDLPSLVEVSSSSSAVVGFHGSDEEYSAAYMRLGDEFSDKEPNFCLHSPRLLDSPCSVLLSCPPSWLESQPQLEDEDTENIQVPLSSSPPEFTSSSPNSDTSSELEKEEQPSSLTSASSGTRSDTASISASHHFDCGPRRDQFSQRLHELLLLVLRDRELERSRTRYEEMDYTTCTSRSDDSGLSTTDIENSGSDDQGVVAKIRTSTPPKRDVTRSPTVLSRWFSDQGFVGQPSKQSSDTLSRSTTSLSYVSDRPRSSGQATQNIDDVDDDISPIRFQIPGNENLRVPENAATTTAEAYRILKRTRSFIRDDKSQDTLMPLRKRQKMQGGYTVQARDRIFASRTASLRRADSLKSVQTIDDRKTPTQAGCVPTVPATPVLAPRKYARKSPSSARALRYPVPIIAPPLDYVPKLPLSGETLAKIRLGKFLEREGRAREKDGLPVSSWKRPLSWMAGPDEDGEYDDDEEGCGTREEEELIEWEVALGIGQHVRQEVIDWILDVMPAPLPNKEETSALPSPSSSSASGSFHSGSSTSSSTSMDRQPSDLMDQLNNSPETRFHAAWMFLRYFYLTMSHKTDMCPSNNTRNLSRQSSLNSNTSASTDQEGRDLVIWDVAVACLSLSVKFHRDFLDPLLPVYVREYLSLAPHHVSYEDLETAQRDILFAFDYSLGVTPQPVMDELWFSLESLRSLLDFENGWQNAMADAWRCLFEAICEPDVQKFSISTLAAVALMDGVIETLVRRYLSLATLKIKVAAASIFNYSSSTSSAIAKGNRRRRRDSVDWRHDVEVAALSSMDNLKGLSRNRKKYLRKAEQASEGVMGDIQALVGITNAQLRDCRDWFSGLH